MPQVGATQRERQCWQQQAVFMAGGRRGGQKKRKNQPIHVELKEKTSTKKKKKRMHNRLSGLSSAVGCSSSSRRRRRHWSGSYEVFPESSTAARPRKAHNRKISATVLCCWKPKAEIEDFSTLAYWRCCCCNDADSDCCWPASFEPQLPHSHQSRASAAALCIASCVCCCCNWKVKLILCLSLLAAFRIRSKQKWHVPSRPLVNPLEAKLLASNWPPRQPVNLRPPPVAWRSPIVIVPELLLCVRSVVTRSRPSCSSASCRSSVWCVKLHRISRPICVSSRQPLAPFRWVACQVCN